MLSCKSSDPRAFIKWSGDDDSLPNYISQTTAGQWVNLTKPENTNNLLPIVQSRLMERKFTSTVNARGQKTKEHAYDTMTLCSRTGRWDYMENHGMDSKPKVISFRAIFHIFDCFCWCYCWCYRWFQLLLWMGAAAAHAQ